MKVVVEMRTSDVLEDLDPDVRRFRTPNRDARIDRARARRRAVGREVAPR